jgi:prophage antirepressor-like protein
MSEIIKREFEFNGSVLTTIIQENGELLFVAKEVCEHLGISDTSMATRNLDEDEKLIQTLLVSGQNRRLTLITESGLYSLVIRSNKPEAKVFKKWITSEVLPSIRTTGGYSLETQFKIPKTFSEALKLAGEQAEVIEQQSLLISEQTPKVIAFENVIDSQNTYTLDSVSDILNIGRTTLARMLEQKKWKTIREENGTSSTRYAEENGFAKTLFEYIRIGKKDIKTKRFVLKKKGLDKLINELTN